jgi:hypothetical protein
VALEIFPKECCLRRSFLLAAQQLRRGMLKTAQHEKLRLLRRFQQDSLADAANTTTLGMLRNLRSPEFPLFPRAWRAFVLLRKMARNWLEC